MANTLREKITSLFKKAALPTITENSSLQEICELYPDFFEFILSRYGVKVSVQDKIESLKKFVSKNNLPPPQVVFMEAQMSDRSKKVGHLTAGEVTSLIDKRNLSILDVREEWELKLGAIPNSLRLTSELLDEILETWEKDKPLLVYCHFGIRSLDAASFLADRGFKNVFILKGGIDSWSTEVDPSIPRYEGAYC